MNNYVYNPIPKGAKIILKEKENCLSIKEIAQKTGYKISTVYYYLCYYDKPNFVKQERRNKIISQLKQGKKQAEIARENNVSRQYVNKLKKKMEIAND